MFFLRIIQFLLGSVRFSADGGFPEKFLNLAAREGIMLWNIRRRGTAVEASVLRRRYARLGPLAMRSGVRLAVLAKEGLPYRATRYTRRRGILIGTALFFTLLWFFSSFIWTVEITGGSSSSTGEIEQVLSDLGLRPGTFVLMINKKAIEQQALLRLTDLSGLTINIHGTDAVVEVRERTWPPDVVPAGTPCNVKAGRTGQIVDIQTYAGQALVHDGDAVTEGEVLISGLMEDKTGGIRSVHASGKAIARTDRELAVTVPFSDRETLPSGKAFDRRTLEIFGFRIPLYWGAPKGHCRQTVSDSRMRLFSLELPLGVETRHCQPLAEKTVTRTAAQAKALALQQLADKEKTELAGAKILTKTPVEKQEASSYTLTAHYTCEENIAFEEIIQIS